MKKILFGLMIVLALASQGICTPIQVDSLLAGLRDNSGNPLSGGLVYTYSAGTTSALACYYDIGGSNQASNPIVLDTTGAAQVYCNGTYKFVVTDSTGSPIKTWDNLSYQGVSSSLWTVVPATITYVTSTQFVIIGDYSSYFPASTAVQVTIAAGPIYGWVASCDYGVTNAGETTVNVAWASTFMTSAVNGTEASVGPSPTTLPPLETAGVVKPFNGFTAPTGYLLCDGTAYSRTTYALLFAVTTISTSGTFTSASYIVTSIPDTSLMKAGMPLSGAKVPTNATIQSVDSGTQIHMSNTASSSGSTAFVVAPWGVGDGASTFNVPDLRGRMIIGNDAGATFFLGAKGGAQTHTQSVAELATHTPIINISDPGHSHLFSGWYYSGVAGTVTFTPTDSNQGLPNLSYYTQTAKTGITATAYSIGNSTPMNIMNPYGTLNYIIKF